MFQARKSKRVRPTRLAGDPDEVLRPRRISVLDRVLVVLLFLLVDGRSPNEWLFPEVNGNKWRASIHRCAVEFWAETHQFAPRSLRPGGACYLLHMDHGWPRPSRSIHEVQANHMHWPIPLQA